MKQLLVMLSLTAITGMAWAQEFIGDVRLPGTEEINEDVKQNQKLDVESCRNGYVVKKIRLTPEHALTLDEVVVVYGNGNEEQLKVRAQYKAGVPTRWIEVTGPNGKGRCINHLKIQGHSRDELAGALIGLHAEVEANGQGSNFEPGPVRFFREDFTCSGFGVSYNVPYHQRRIHQKALCDQNSQDKSVKFALIKDKCVKIAKENMGTACLKVMHNQEQYYNHNGNPPLNILNGILNNL